MHATPSTGASAPRESSASIRPWLWALLLYFGAQLCSRLWVSDALELDEAEQALWTQHLALGYGAQPPLYTWLQYGVFQLFGVSVFSLALLKNVLLGSTYVFTFLAGRLLLPAPLAALAAASMLLLPQIGWESQRDLTHSVVATTMSACMLWLLLRLVQHPRPALYLALGVATALGVMGKYSVTAYALALLGALLLGRDTRGIVLDRWMLAAVVLALALLAPHGGWLLAHWGQATEGTLSKMEAGTRPSYLAGVGQGLGSLLLAVVAFLTPCWLVLLALFGRALRRPSDAADGAAAQPATAASAAALTGRACALWRRYAVLVLALFVAMVLAGAASRFKDRWMQPYLFFAPLAFFGCLPHLATHPRLPWLRRVVIGMALLILLLLTLRVPYNGWRGKPDELNLPARVLAHALVDAGYDGRTIVATDRVLAGVLRLQFPDANVVAISPREAARLPPGPRLWISPGRDDQAVQRPMVQHAGAMDGGRGLPAVQALELPYRHARPGAVPLAYRFALQP